MKSQIIDVDYFLKNNKPIIRVYMKSETGKTVIGFYEGFEPYFYVDDNKDKVDEVLALCDKKILRTEIDEKKPGIGYVSKPKPLVKIFLENPRDVPEVRNFLEQHGINKIYEADIRFKYRFMIDKNLYGMGWVDFEGQPIKTSLSNYPCMNIRSIKPLFDIKKNTELKVLSFDIECYVTNPQKLVNPKTDPIIMISLAFSHEYRGHKNLVITAKPLKEKKVFSFENEEEMLNFFTEIIHEYDPDILTGYNINGFDIPYILDRMKLYGIPAFLGRNNDKPMFVKSLGYRKISTVPGRVIVDPYQLIKADPFIRFSRYNLNTVSKNMLNETKEDVEYKEINKLWDGNVPDLKRLVSYARTDSILAIKLLLDKGLVDKFFEIAKVSGTLLQDALGGQSIRIETMILHEAKKRNMIIPCKPDKNELRKRAKSREKAGLKGAIVLEPKKGLHAKGCTLVLDFKSLYPSLIRTYNISPDTFIINETPENIIESPVGARFVDSKEYKGVMPELLEYMMVARSKVKKEMSNADGDLKRVLDARQTAFKILSNSFYGYTGYLQARLYKLEVANSTTGFGRKGIMRTKKEIEEKYPNVEILYGDTDSVMINTNITDLDEARKLGDEIGSHITNILPGCLELEFEKIYRTFLILSKKRYAGWKFEPGKKGWEDSIEMKGIETVRRDWCALVSESMNYVLRIILKQGDIKKAMDYVKKVIIDLKEGKVSLEKLTIVKGITKSLESYEGVLPHIEVAKKINKRNPQQPVLVGERVGYVIVKGNQMLSKRAESPEYVKEQGLQIDPDYYVKNQLIPPLERIFASLDISRDELMGTGRQMNFFDMINGDKRKLKHDINVNQSETPKNPVLSDVEEFVCEKCHKNYDSIPMSGLCECGGKLLLSHNGNTSDKCKTCS